MHGLQEADALEEARYAVMKASYEVKLLLAEIAHKRFDPSQPRVPSGNSDGGQWTSTGGSREGRVQVAQRAPRRRDPHNFGARRDNSGPRTTPIKIAGRTEWVTTALANQYHSSYALAQSMTSLARSYNRSWRPESTIVGNVAGQIAANQATAAQALRFLKRYGSNWLPHSTTISIVAPNGQLIGYIAPRAGKNVRTLRTEREMERAIAQLLVNGRPLARPNYNGIAYQRPDGVIVTIRSSYRNGITVDLQFPRGIEPPVRKLHLFGAGKKTIEWCMESKDMEDTYPYPAIKNVKFSDVEIDWNIENRSFVVFCEESVENPEFAEPVCFSYFQKIFYHYSNHDNFEVEKATRYFLGYVMSRGYAPMNFANARDRAFEYGPITKYGLRPQEIIDNIVADWRSRGCVPFRDQEVMFGWEHDCGVFMEDDPE
jgi:hypothetical protein